MARQVLFTLAIRGSSPQAALMFAPRQRLLVLALQAALAVAPALEGPERNRPLDRASVVEDAAVSDETGVLSQLSVAEQGGVILKSAHARVTGEAVTDSGWKTSPAATWHSAARVGVRWTLASLLVRLQI